MRVLFLIYGAASYLAFLHVFVYFMGFVGDVFVPQSVSHPASAGFGKALLIDIGVMLLFGIQHSVMARAGFKSFMARVIPRAIERATYVLASAIVLALLMFWWRPIEGTVWSLENPAARAAVWALFALGWLLIFTSTFLTDHFDLFGLRQVWLSYVRRTYTDVRFTERLFYRSIRHPMMLGILIAFWASPVMSVSHLVFSIGMSLYVLVGIHFEEKGLQKVLGRDYVAYQKRTRKIVPSVY